MNDRWYLATCTIFRKDTAKQNFYLNKKSPFGKQLLLTVAWAVVCALVIGTWLTGTVYACQQTELITYPESYGWGRTFNSCGGYGTYDWVTASQQLSQAEICANRPNYAPGAIVAKAPDGSPVCAYPNQINGNGVAGGCYDYLGLTPYCHNPETNEDGPINVFGGPPCYYYRCADQQYVIKLSLPNGVSESASFLTSVEPTDMFSRASGKNATYLIARVYDQNGQMVPNVNVQLTVDVKPNSGGHQHDDIDRHTEYMGQLASPQGIAEQSGKVLKGNTGAYGLAFSFTAPEPAGDHFFTAKCTDGKTCTLQGPDTIWVGVKDNGQLLTRLPDSPLWVPVGVKNIHPDNHYLTRAALSRLTLLAQAYHDQFPTSPVLRMNDASLVRGGVFDIDVDPYTDKNGNYHSRTLGGQPGHWWTAPHAEHRRGTVIDIRANGASDAIPSKNYRQFEDIVNRLGMNYLFEKNHFHVRLTGIAE